MASGTGRITGNERGRVLDLLHVTPRLWKAAHVFHAEKSAAAEAFVRVRLLRVLQGKAKDVLRGLRQMTTKHELTGTKKKTLREIGGYLEHNLTRTWEELAWAEKSDGSALFRGLILAIIVNTLGPDQPASPVPARHRPAAGRRGAAGQGPDSERPPRGSPAARAPPPLRQVHDS